MAPLGSLEPNYPLIDSDFRQFCASQGIFSVEDFLIHDIYMLAALAEQYPNSYRLKEGITQILSIMDCEHQPWQNALDMLEDSCKCKQFLSTGCQRIDTFLHGGLRQGFLTELVGSSSSGKTQVCLLAASSIAKTCLDKVMFIDTGNSFSARRIAEFIKQSADHAYTACPGMENDGLSRNLFKYLTLHNSKCYLQLGTNAKCYLEQDNKVLPQILDNIICCSVFDIFKLLDVLHDLFNNLKYQTGHHLKMLIVDSISSLITPILGGNGAQGHALMASAGFLLKKLAHDHNLAVLITNHTVAGKCGSTKPALGESWKSIPHVRLMISRDPGRSSNKISILMHPAMPIGSTMEYSFL